MTRHPPGEEPTSSTPWFRRWFGEAYLRLYPHRDEAEAARAVRLLLDHTELDAEARVLDLACGAGRHLRSLSQRGLRTVGLDLSAPLLRRAREGGHAGPLVRGDMRRLPFSAGAFAAVTSFFTSFGYFRSPTDDEQVLGEIARVLVPRGTLLLDLLNATRVRDTLIARDEEEIDGRRVVQERRLVDDGQAVEKTIRIERDAAGEPEVYHERVRLYPRDALGTLLSRRGFEPLAWFGDYDGAPAGPDTPRTIVLARASAASGDRSAGASTHARRPHPDPRHRP